MRRYWDYNVSSTIRGETIRDRHTPNCAWTMVDGEEKAEGKEGSQRQGVLCDGEEESEGKAEV